MAKAVRAALAKGHTRYPSPGNTQHPAPTLAALAETAAEAVLLAAVPAVSVVIRAAEENQAVTVPPP